MQHAPTSHFCFCFCIHHATASTRTHSVDNALGFQTHKMQKDYQRIDIDTVVLEEIMMGMGADRDVDKAMRRLFGVRTFR
jgi:hypothetical protein